MRHICAGAPPWTTVDPCMHLLMCLFSECLVGLHASEFAPSMVLRGTYVWCTACAH